MHPSGDAHSDGIVAEGGSRATGGRQDHWAVGGRKADQPLTGGHPGILPRSAIVVGATRRDKADPMLPCLGDRLIHGHGRHPLPWGIVAIKACGHAAL